MPAIPVHHTEVDTESEWDGSAETAKLETPITATIARGIFAWYDPNATDENEDGYPDIKGGYKFPHHNVNASGEPGAANLRAVNNAVARLSQADIPESDIEDVLSHLRAHQEDAKENEESRKMDKSTNPLKRMFQAIAEVIDEFAPKERAVNLSQIWQSVNDKLNEGGTDGMPVGYVLEMYMEQAGPFAIVTKGDGKLYKMPVTVDADSKITVGEMVEVVTEFSPVAREVTVKRQVDGKIRWYAFPACTAVLNRSGEIDSRALFDSFVEYAERTENYPELDFFHLGERMVLGKADWIGRDGVSYCASGLFDDTPVARAAAESIEKNPGYWGLSIAYIPTKEPEVIRSADGVEINVFNAGINRFISLLPEDTAASILTSINTKEDEVNRMNKKFKEALEKLANGDEKLLDEWVEKLDGVNRSADGMISREAESKTEGEKPAEVKREITEDDIAMIIASDAFKTAVGEIVAAKMADAAAMVEESKDEGEGKQEERAVDPLESIRESIAVMQTTLEGLTKERKAEADAQKAIEADMPSKLRNKQNIVRPRAAILPATVNKGGKDYAAIAERTLAKMNNAQGA